MNEMIEQKIKNIIESHEEIPTIFKKVLKKELALLEQEAVLDVVNIKREYSDITKKTDIFTKAVLLIATSFGLVVVEEGVNDLHLEFGGYRVRHVMYSKIKCMDFNSCLLIGTLKVTTGSINEPDLLLEFNTSKYYSEIEKIVEIIRGKMIECERKLLS